MGKDPSFPFYQDDWLSSGTVHRMGLVEQGAYVRLLALCWASGDCSLPDDDDELRELAGLSEDIMWGHPEDIANGNLSRCQTTRWDLLRSQFIAHPLLSHRLTSAKLYGVYLEREAFRAERSRSGAAGAKKRWEQHRKSLRRKEKRKDSSANAKPMANDSSSFTSSSSFKVKPPLSPLEKLDDEINFPAGFGAPEVRIAWHDWLKHKPKKYKNHETASIALRTYCENFETPERLVRGINLAIAGGWQGLSLDATVKDDRARGGEPDSEPLDIAGALERTQKGGDE